MKTHRIVPRRVAKTTPGRPRKTPTATYPVFDSPHLPGREEIFQTSRAGGTREVPIQKVFLDQATNCAFAYDTRVTPAHHSATSRAKSSADERSETTPTNSAFPPHDRIGTAFVIPASYADVSFSSASTSPATFKLDKVTTEDTVEKEEAMVMSAEHTCQKRAHRCGRQEQPTSRRANGQKSGK
ncbi:hypothetical protein MTO96_045729 [Rhipicephalus appendiculatus]